MAKSEELKKLLSLEADMKALNAEMREANRSLRKIRHFMESNMKEPKTDLDLERDALDPSSADPEGQKYSGRIHGR